MGCWGSHAESVIGVSLLEHPGGPTQRFAQENTQAPWAPVVDFYCVFLSLTSIRTLIAKRYYGKIVQNGTKKIPKCLVGTGKISLGSTLATLRGRVGPKDALAGPKLLILTSYIAHLDLSFSILQLFWHYRRCRFGLQSSSQSSYNDLCCPQLVDLTSEHNFASFCDDSNLDFDKSCQAAQCVCAHSTP